MRHYIPLIYTIFEAASWFYPPRSRHISGWWIGLIVVFFLQPTRELKCNARWVSRLVGVGVIASQAVQISGGLAKRHGRWNPIDWPIQDPFHWLLHLCRPTGNMSCLNSTWFFKNGKGIDNEFLFQRDTQSHFPGADRLWKWLTLFDFVLRNNLLTPHLCKQSVLRAIFVIRLFKDVLFCYLWAENRGWKSGSCISF